jgi:hypothetical protein
MTEIKLSEAQKEIIAGNQFYKCANKPGKKLFRLEGFDCPYWKREGNDKGSFDASGYEIDHINEFNISKDESPNNLQALCLPCHAMKTIISMINPIPCQYCPKSFARKDSLKEHLDKGRCKGKKIIENKIINDNIIENPKPNFTINKYGKLDNNNTNNFLLNYPFNFSIIYENIKEILSSNEDLNLAIVKHTHVNKNRPECHNIYYQDRKSAMGEIYQNNIWNITNIYEITNLILETNNTFLTSIQINFGPIFINETNEKLINTIKNFNNPTYRKFIKRKIKYLLYDNRHMIATTKKLFDESQKIIKSHDFNNFDINIKNLVSNRFKKPENNNLSFDEDSDESFEDSDNDSSFDEYCRDQIIKNGQKSITNNQKSKKNIKSNNSS